MIKAIRPTSLYRYSLVTLLANILVILWVAYVRATGARAGCGNYWPLCNGLIVPRSPALEIVVEFTHRLSSGVAFLLVLGLLILVRRDFTEGHRVRTFAAASMFFNGAGSPDRSGLGVVQSGGV
jgi:heme A synthase